MADKTSENLSHVKTQKSMIHSLQHIFKSLFVTLEALHGCILD
jgi:hypothetical protein